MKKIVIAAASRTAMGSFQGGLSALTAPQLGAAAIQETVKRAGVNIEGWSSSAMTRTFFFDNPKEGTYFWKQFLAGIFLVVATTGLDQDLMQRT